MLDSGEKRELAGTKNSGKEKEVVENGTRECVAGQKSNTSFRVKRRKSGVHFSVTGPCCPQPCVHGSSPAKKNVRG